MAQMDWGPANTWADFSTEEGKSNAAFDALKEKYFLPYYKVQKSCPYNKSLDCFAYSNGYVKQIDGVGAYLSTMGFEGISCFVIADGTSICLRSAGYDNYLVALFVDINGKKGPNIAGRDLFLLEPIPFGKNKYLSYVFPGGRIQNMTRDKLLGKEGNYQGKCKKGTNERQSGVYCGALIQRDGWQIKDDYPW